MGWIEGEASKMLVALVSGRVGPTWVAGFSVLLLLTTFTAAVFAAQTRMPERIGCLVFFGEDFVQILASASLLVAGEGPAVYDPSLLDDKGTAILESLLPFCGPAGTSEYWPAFLVPFFALTPLPARAAYYLWTSLTGLLFTFALWRLARVCRVASWVYWLIALSFLPVMAGLAEGQVHGLQFLALVEFWIAMRRQDHRSAGLWLSLQLVKFQFLPGLLLYVLWHRRWRVLGWFSLAGLVWLGSSVLLAGGATGIIAYARMMLDVVAPLNAEWGVHNMVNWRGLAFDWFPGSGLDVVGGVTAGLTLLTVGLLVWSWHRRSDEAARLEPQQFLGLMAGTLLVGYDTFSYSLVLLLAPILLVLGDLRMASGPVVWLWSALVDFAVLAPMLILAASFALGMSLPLGVGESLLLALVTLFAAGVFSPRLTSLSRWRRPGEVRVTARA